MKNKKVTIGFLTYGKSTSKYLKQFLESIKNQTFQDFDLIMFDNTPSKEELNSEIAKKKYPNIKIKREGVNLGFSCAYNKIIRQASSQNAKYFFVINPDTYLEEDCLENLVKCLDNDPNLGSVSPKILQWDFKTDQNTGRIDTCGIEYITGLRFKDIKQNEEDINLEKGTLKILGPSGAAGLYRMSALKKVAENNNYFDELMFMYKEDCDLAYRLFLAGYSSICHLPTVIYHDRTASAKGTSTKEIIANRKNLSREVRAWSFLNQQILFIKYSRLLSYRERISVDWYWLKMIIYALLKEQFLLPELLNLALIKPKIKIYKKTK